MGAALGRLNLQSHCIYLSFGGTPALCQCAVPLNRAPELRKAIGEIPLSGLSGLRWLDCIPKWQWRFHGWPRLLLAAVIVVVLAHVMLNTSMCRIGKCDCIEITLLLCSVKESWSSAIQPVEK